MGVAGENRLKKKADEHAVLHEKLTTMKEKIFEHKVAIERHKRSLSQNTEMHERVGSEWWRSQPGAACNGGTRSSWFLSLAVLRKIDWVWERNRRPSPNLTRGWS